MKKCERITGVFITYKDYLHDHPYIKMVSGIILIIIGFVALVTPLTPGSWLIIFGLELIGVRLVICNRILNLKKK